MRRCSSVTSAIVCPFVLASVLSILLYPALSGDHVRFSGFALFMGAAMAITAFPVLARILSEKLLNTKLGTVAIACAAVDDVTGWCVLAYIVVLIRADRAALPFWMVVGGAAIFAAILIFGLRRVLRRLLVRFERSRELSSHAASTILILAFTSALVTEWLGLHVLFGAFLMGAIMPKDPEFVRQFSRQRFESVSVDLLLPIFFAFTGLRTSIGLVHGRVMWGYCGLIILVAITGKFGGSMLAARLAGMPLRTSAALGLLMNTRGLMELVVPQYRPGY